MTTLVYNDVILRDCETTSMQQTVEYDDSKTDVMFSRFRIRVASTLVAFRNSSGVTQFGIDTPDGLTVVQRMHDVQARLSESRKDFWFLIDDCVQDERAGLKDGSGNPIAPDNLDQPLLIACGKAYDETMIDVILNSEVVGKKKVYTPLHMSPHPFSLNSDTDRYGPGEVDDAPQQIKKHLVLDCDNGPKPIDVRIIKIIGGRSFRVEFEIEVCLRVCPLEFSDEDYDPEDDKPVVYGDVSGDSRILSNRWSLTESKDENWVTTKVFQGTLRVKDRQYWPHMMRMLCVPPLLNGYRRMKQSYATDPTGLTLKYRIEDRQAHAAPPKPAVSFSGHYIESATGSMGVTKHGDVRIRMVGPPGVDKQQLIAAAFKIAINRVQGLVPEETQSGATKTEHSTILTNASVIDVIDQPVIELRLQAKYADDSYKSLALRIGAIGAPLNMGEDDDEDPGTPPAKPDYIDDYLATSHPIPLPYDSTKPAGIFNCYLQHPCSIWHDIPGVYSPSDEGKADPIVKPDEEESGTTNEESAELNNREEPLVFPEDDDKFVPVSGGDIQGQLDFYSYPYTFIAIEQRYEFNEGWVGLPLATTAPGARSMALVRMHARTARRILTMTATRNGLPPMIPSLDGDIVDENGCREVLDTATISSLEPKLGPDGTAREYSVKTEHVYLMEKAPENDDILRGASSPIDRFSPDSNHLDLSKIIDTGGTIQWKNGITTTYPPPSP